MFVDWALIPRIRIPVYPTPAPASDVVTTEGKKFNKTGMSCPKLRLASCSLVTLVCVIGDLASTRTAFTKTSSSSWILVESCSFSWAKH